ncbi:OmpA family protein [Idiomarina sp. A28L]|uniref:OmpA family protein n=1 Tax=Idiomarina sp. A28L TaxID=1036674 RepID=UPI001ED94436|nr:OmpA family protein [Idiomarina sp. A28L]
MMKTNKITQAIGTAIGTLTLFGLALPAVASQKIESGWYLGVGGGSSQATIARADIIADLLESGYTTTEFNSDTKDFGFKIYGGYQFNRHISIEGGYFDLGEFSYTATTIPAGTSFGELEFDGWNLDVVAMLPLTEKSSLFVRIGAHSSKASVDFVGTGAVNVLNPRFQKTSTDYKFGFGYQYEMTERVTFRIEAERYRMDDAVGNHGDLDLFSVNLIYRFGTRSRPEATPAPAPRAVVAAPVQPAATTQYCGVLEIQFEIANDDIQRINREHVLVLATFLDKYPETKVEIEGHTDNVGTRADNLRLSQQRAENAVDYLVREHGIDRDRLSATGYGESRPVADNSTEAGKQANRRINAVIDCATDIEGLTPLPARITLAMELEFDTNSSVVDPKYHDQLGTVAEYLRRHPELTATLEGHTDNANADRAQRVSQERAQSVANYLVTHFGIDRSRLTAEGFGATRRDTYNITASGRQENRRVTIILDYPK